jgi:hypothetical protein
VTRIRGVSTAILGAIQLSVVGGLDLRDAWTWDSTREAGLAG